MMPPAKRRDPSLLIGVILVAVGGLMLLGQLTGGLMSTSFMPALLFLLGGGIFVSFFLRDREQWWALIPGAALAGIGATLLADGLGFDGGSAFMGVLSLGFLGIFLVRREQWWALIPGGVLMTIAFVAGGRSIVPGTGEDTTFFLGLFLTFGAVMLLAKQPWAIWPAGAMLGLVLLTWSGSLQALLGGLGPILLLALGAWLVFGRTDEEESSSQDEAPKNEAA